jgi:hypothetical protein
MSTNHDLTSTAPPTDPVAYEAWLDGIVRLPEGARLRGGIHPDTLKKDAIAKGELLQLGPRAIGVRRRFALMLPQQSRGRRRSFPPSLKRSTAPVTLPRLPDTS